MKALFYFADGRISIDDVPENAPPTWTLRDKTKTESLQKKRKLFSLRGDVPIESSYIPYVDAYFVRVKSFQDASFATYEERVKVKA